VSRSLFLGLVFYSVSRHGLHFFSFFFPAGIPFRLAPFIVVLEMISFFFRPVSLGVRLRANMTAGHLLLHTVRGFVRTLLSAGGLIFPLVGRRRGVILEGVFLLETRVCFLQAYVFTALFTIYLKDAEDLH
jgi:ATP synthase subunit 6